MTIGPLLIAMDRGVAILCIMIFFGLGALAARWGAVRFAGIVTSIVLAGVVAARIGHVAGHAAIYADAPWTALAVWQGGFSPPAGIAGAAALLVVRLGRSRDTVVGLIALAVPAMLWFAVQAIVPAIDHGRFPYGVTLVDTDGRPLPLARFRGHPFAVNLWATWCGPCRRELPMLAKAADREGEVPIILADQGESAQAVSAFLSREAVASCHIALDTQRQLSTAFDVAGYPATLFVAADGTVVRLQLGELSRAALADGIDMARKHR